MSRNFRWIVWGMILGALATGVQAVLVYGVDGASIFFYQAVRFAGLIIAVWLFGEIATWIFHAVVK